MDANERTNRTIKREKVYELARSKKGLTFDSHAALWKWSVENLEQFWETVWEYCSVQSSAPYTSVLEERKMPRANWFPGARLNYVEHIFRNMQEKPALLFRSEHVSVREVTWKELKQQTAAVASALKKLGVKQGDRVVA